ncbi:hypothetical protein TrLO_g3942 [Triparma laevis f. longispina]|uniref:Sfi1 spindle body domain-containing protein n=1 Tax=Triparma laevis f. longispina TaxID=1714387 RepID=A0A9W7FTU1_9STRA|nr:hypothetical protein TrLO_g3942 [Triparma laevis f. longispina]
MEVDDMYHVLSMAFLLMEDEREEFRQELKEVEGYFEEKWRAASSFIQKSEDKEETRRIERSARIKSGGARSLGRMLTSLMRKVYSAWRQHSHRSKIQRLNVKMVDFSLLDSEVKRLLAEREALKVQIVSERENLRKEMKDEREILKAKMSLLSTEHHEKSMNSAMKLIKTWQNRLVVVCYQSWITFTAKEKKKRNSTMLFLKRWRKSSMWKIFNNWVSFKNHEKRARYIIGKYSKRMKQLGLQKTINSWLDFVDRRSRVRLVCKRMINKTLNDGLLRGFMAWFGNVAEEKREEEIRNLAAGEESSKTAGMKLGYENEISKARSHKQKLSLKIVQQMIDSTLANTYQIWKTWTGTQIANRNLLERFAKKWKQQGIVRVINAWVEFVGRRKFLRAFLGRLAKLASQQGIQKYFKRWHLKCYAFASASLEDRIKELEDRLVKATEREGGLKYSVMKLESEKALVEANIGVKERAAREAKLSRAHNYINRWKNESLSHTFKRWVVYREGCLRAKRIELKVINKILNSRLVRIVQSWSNFVKEEKRKRVAVFRFKQRWLNSLAASVINAWLQHVGKRKRIKKLVKRWFSNKEFGKLIASWSKWVMFLKDLDVREESQEKKNKYESERQKEQLRKKKLSLRIIQVAVNGCLAVHLNMWKEWLKDLKKERVIVARFINRLKNKAVISCLNSWRENVKMRKRLRGFVSRMLNNADLNEIRSGFAQWRARVAVLTGEEMNDKIKVLEREVEELKREKGEVLKKFGALKNEKALTDGKLTDSERAKKDLKLKQAHNFINTWKNKCLGVTFSALAANARDNIRRKTITSRFMTRWANRQIMKCFDTWKFLYEEAVRHDQLVFKYASRIIRMGLFKAYTAWGEYAKQQKRYQLLVDRFRRRMFNVILNKAYRSWREFVGGRQNMRSFAKKWFARQQNTKVAAAWRTWSKNVYETIKWERMSEVNQIKEEKRILKLQKNTELVLRSLQNIINNAVSSGFNTWKALVLEERKNRVIIDRYVRRWKGMYVMKCYITWVDFVVERRELRGIVRKFLGGKKMQELAAGFNTWADWCVEEEEREREADLDRLRLAAEEGGKRAEEGFGLARKKEEKARVQGEKAARNMFAMKLKGMLGSCFMAWKEDVRNTRRVTLRMKLILGKMAHATLAAAWSSWVKSVGNFNRNMLGEVKGERERVEASLKVARGEAKRFKEARMRKVLNAIVTRECFMAFEFWRNEVEEFKRHEMLVKKYAARLLKGGLLKVMLAWVEFAKTSKRHRFVVGKFKARYNSLAAAKAYGSWAAMVKTKKRHAIVVSRFRRRFNNMTVLKATNAWIDYVMRRRRIRTLTRKLFNRLNNAGLSAGWATWVELVERLKKEEYVIGIFVKRWRNVQVFKLFQGWKRVVEENRWGRGDEEEVGVGVGVEDNKGGMVGVGMGGIDSVRNRLLSAEGRARSSTMSSVRSDRSRGPAQVMSGSGNGHGDFSVRVARWGVDEEGGGGDFGGDFGMGKSGLGGGLSELVRRIEANSNNSSSISSGDGRGWSKVIAGSLEMSKEQKEGLELAKFNLKKALGRAEFEEVESSLRVDRSLFVKRLKQVIGRLGVVNEDVLALVRGVFRNRGFSEAEKAFKGWAIGADLFKRERAIAFDIVLGVVRRIEVKKLALAFGAMKLFVLTWRGEMEKMEFADKTRKRLRIQAAQVSKAREESLRIGRNVMDKLTSSRRQNLLEKCFDALVRAREMKVTGVMLVNRWMLAARTGGLMWAFHSWKSKANAASGYMSRAAFLNAADGETRAHLAFILNRFWRKKDCGSFGADPRSDKRMGFLRWKHAVVKEIEMEKAWAEVELKTRACSNVLGLIGELGSQDRDGFSYNDSMYMYVKRGCLVMAQPGTGKYLLLSGGSLQIVPNGCGVLGNLIESKKLSFCKQILKDPSYDEVVDDVLLESCGRPVFQMERNAAIRYQSLAMKTSNIHARTTRSKNSQGRMRRAGDRHGSVVVGMLGEVGGGTGIGSLSGISTKVDIPDVGLMCMPIRIGKGPIIGAVVAVGKAEVLDEGVARNLSLISTAVGGGYLSMARSGGGRGGA